MEIRYIDRQSGATCVEKVYGGKGLLFLYGDGLLNRIIRFILSLPFFSYCYGLYQKSCLSKRKVEPFIKEYEVDRSEFAKQEFSSFNDFFIRKLKPETRPIVQDPNVLSMPADGRYLVYPTFSQFSVKGKDFSLRTFLGNVSLANRYQDGSLAIIRLCPVDYHRFHFPCDGVASKPTPIDGSYYSVSPIALSKRLSILNENKRVVTEIETERFGQVLFVEIGATFVGSIHQTYNPLGPIKKGEEKGYFEFGGSCVVLLFEKGKVEFDADLLKNTQNGFETLARYGQSLCKAALH